MLIHLLHKGVTLGVIDYRGEILNFHQVAGSVLFDLRVSKSARTAYYALVVSATCLRDIVSSTIEVTGMIIFVIVVEGHVVPVAVII